jgi:hypothetical protein
MDAPDFRYDAELNTPAFFATDGYHEAFKFLRRDDPVHWTHGRNGWDFWSVTKHEDCVAVLRQPEIYCSSRGVMLPYRAAGREQTPDQVGAGLSVLMSDPPRHREMRKLIFEWFRTGRIDSLEPAVRKMSIEIVNAAGAQGPMRSGRRCRRKAAGGAGNQSHARGNPARSARTATGGRGRADARGGGFGHHAHAGQVLVRSKRSERALRGAGPRPSTGDDW